MIEFLAAIQIAIVLFGGTTLTKKRKKRCNPDPGKPAGCLGDKMKKFLAFALAVAMAMAPVAFAQSTKPKEVNVTQDERAVTGTILIPVRGHLEMICSGVETGHDSDGNGVFVTARHCVFDPDVNMFYRGEVVSFSADGSGPYYPTQLYEVSNTDDLAVLKLMGAGTHPEAQIEDERQLNPGDPVDNISYPEFMGKLEFHGAFVAPSWPHVPEDVAVDFPEWVHAMPVDITIAPGSSGSPLFDSKTHAVIGIMVGSTGAGRLMIAEPITLLVVMVATGDGNIERFIRMHPQKVYLPSTPSSSPDSEE